MTIASDLPNLEARDESYYRPYTPPEYPEVPKNYLPDNVRLHFEFGQSAHSDHFKSTAAHLAASDLYIPEAAGAPKEALRLYRQATQSNPAKFAKLIEGLEFKDSYDSAQLLALQGTKKVICFVDVDETTLQGILGGNHAVPQTFEERLVQLYDAHFRLKQLTDVRDTTIAEKLGGAITQAAANYPKLRKKSEVTALVSLGSIHMPVYDHLSHLPNVSAAEWRLNEKGLLRSTRDAIFSRIAANQPVSRTELLRGFLANASGYVLPYRTESNEAEFALQNAVLQVFFDEIANGSAEMVHRIKEGAANDEDYERNEAYFEQARANLRAVQEQVRS